MSRTATSITAQAHQHEILDALAWRHLGTTRGVVEVSSGMVKISRPHEWRMVQQGGKAAPWTCVNNCTDGTGAGFQGGAELDDDDRRAMHHDEFGRWAGWAERLHAAATAKQPLDKEKAAAQRQN